MSSATIRQSPIILIRMFVLIELVALCAYLIATMFDVYKLEFYTLLPFSKIFSYQAFKFPFLSSVQFVIFVYAFLRWYRDYYAVGPGSLTHFWGAFVTKQKHFDLNQSTSFVVRYDDPLGKLKSFHYGSIEVNSDGDKAIIRSISWPEKSLSALEEAARETDPAELLRREENERLEFKSTLRFDHKSGQVNRDLERTAMKTIAAFLNSKGGQLLIGVDNDRRPTGLMNDYGTLRRSDSDGFENHFTQIYNAMIGPEFHDLTKLSFHKIDGRDICLVRVKPSGRPVYLKTDGNEHFYVRTGNITTSLRFSEMELYARSRWPRRLSET